MPLRGSHVSKLNPSALISQTWALTWPADLFDLTWFNSKSQRADWQSSPTLPYSHGGVKTVTLRDRNLQLNFYLHLQLLESFQPVTHWKARKKKLFFFPLLKSLGKNRSSRWLSRIMGQGLLFTKVLPQPAVFALCAAAVRLHVCFFLKDHFSLFSLIFFHVHCYSLRPSRTNSDYLWSLSFECFCFSSICTDKLQN